MSAVRAPGPTTVGPSVIIAGPPFGHDVHVPPPERALAGDCLPCQGAPLLRHRPRDGGRRSRPRALLGAIRGRQTDRHVIPGGIGVVPVLQDGGAANQ